MQHFRRATFVIASFILMSVSANAADFSSALGPYLSNSAQEATPRAIESVRLTTANGQESLQILLR